MSSGARVGMYDIDTDKMNRVSDGGMSFMEQRAEELLTCCWSA